jgi:hypothetical protein
MWQKKMAFTQMPTIQKVSNEIKSYFGRGKSIYPAFI